MILSGFIFDLRSAPAWADVMAHCLPPVYYLEVLKVGFLTGGMEDLVLKNMVILSLLRRWLLLLLTVCVRRGCENDEPIARDA